MLGKTILYVTMRENNGMSVVILVDYEEIRVVNDLDGWG